MKKIKQIFTLPVLLFVFSICAYCEPGATLTKSRCRERLLMDFGWRFALGHAFDAEKDFNFGTDYFSFYTKTGYGDGPAAEQFDDRAWRILDLPHDWVVELPFDSSGGHSHGYKAVGRNFPQNSVGWYRKQFFIPESDLGRRIIIEFDGIHRNVMLFINGFYIGEEHSGYSSFQYDITDYLNYGGDNVIAVRVDVIIEEGWFYEGAGIYRHVWLTKTSPLHVAQYGTYVTTKIKEGSATVTAAATVYNENKTEASFFIVQTIQDASGKLITAKKIKKCILKSGEKKEYSSDLKVKNPNLWSLDSPYLYTLFTSIFSKDTIIDQYKTTFGIRSVRFDPNKGFFLNGKHVQLKGTNNHQDHAGVGTAIPDALQEFRIKTLKSMGCNAYRCSHNPPTPELLDACDRLGMLVMDENRLMGSSPEHLQQLERLILRDRNHPSVIIWSLGNEEWAIEGNIKGERIATTMQTFVRRLDPTRRITVASSGGWGNGVSGVIDVMGFNYLRHGNIDEHHVKFPNQPGMGTEETTGSGTRGIYEDDRENGHMAQMDRVSNRASIERGIQYYQSRKYLAGVFFWTGFDYRGEPNPLVWPAVSSQYGIVDLCGFPKDIFYYLQSVWKSEPILHLFPHWNWAGKEQQIINVWAYSNSDEVELFLNGQSLGRKQMERLSHIEWDVPYEPGKLLARAYKNGKEILVEKVETTGDPAAIRLIPDRSTIKADGEDVSVITVRVEDTNGRIVPTACNEVSFDLQGSGKMIGMGNGDPSSHEPDVFRDTIIIEKIRNLRMAFTRTKDHFQEVNDNYNESNWIAFEQTNRVNSPQIDTLIIVRGSFELPALTNGVKVTLFTKSICENQAVYINGQLLRKDIPRNAPDQAFPLDYDLLKEGKNIFAVTGSPFIKTHIYEELNTDPGVVRIFIPAKQWKRKVFNGLAQMIVQSNQQPGEIKLTAISPGLKSTTIQLTIKSVSLRPAVPDQYE